MIGLLLMLLITKSMFFHFGGFLQFFRVFVVNKILVERVCCQSSLVLATRFVHFWEYLNL